MFLIFGFWLKFVVPQKVKATLKSPCFPVA